MGGTVEIVDRLFNQLVTGSFAELAARPQVEELTPVEGGRVTVAIWKDNLPSSDVRVVVQASRGIALGAGLVYARGFVKRQDGTCVELDRDELREFS